jgi:hypothetical protein
MHNFIHTGPARLSNLSSINQFDMEARVGIGLTRWLYGIGYIPNEGYLRTSFLSPCVLKYL